MKTPPDIRFLGIDPSPALQASIAQHCAKLCTLCEDITACHVFVELSDRHRCQGRQFHVRVDVAVPGRPLIVSRAHREDAYHAINEAFHIMAQQVGDAMDWQEHGRAGSLPPDEGERPLAPLSTTAPVQGSQPCR